MIRSLRPLLASVSVIGALVLLPSAAHAADTLGDALARLAPSADPKVIGLAVRAAECAQVQGGAPAERLAVIDYSKPSSEPRLWVFDTVNRKLLFQELVAHGKLLIDTTCPLVTRLHRAAQELAESGAFVVVIGRPDHVEIQGVTDDLSSYAVVRSVDDVVTYLATTIGVVCQTTFPCAEAAAIRQQIEARNPTATIR